MKNLFLLFLSLCVSVQAGAATDFVARCIDGDTDVRAAVYFNWEGRLPPEFPEDCEAGYRLLLEKKEVELAYSNRIDFISEFTQIESLKISRTKFGSLAPLAKLTELRALDIDGGRYFLLTPLAYLSKLESLTLDNNRRVNDLTALQGLEQLRTLRMRHDEVNWLGPVAIMTQLETLDMQDNKIDDASPLRSLSALTNANLRQNQLSESACRQQLAGYHLVDQICSELG